MSSEDLVTDPKAKPKKSKRQLVTGPAQLPLWGERVRGAPNVLVRSAFFTCADKRKARRKYVRDTIVSLNGVKIQYTGIELRQDDLTVWLQIAHLARMHPLGDQVEVHARSLMTAIGWRSDGGGEYARLRESIARMKEGTVWVEYDSGVNGFAGNLISSLEWSDAGSGDRERWKLYFDRKILALFQPDTFTLLEWEARLGLGPLSQWLHGFFSSHADPYPYKVETIYRLCGSMNSSMDGFKRSLLRALDDLKEAKLVVDYTYNARTKTIQVQRKPGLPALEQ